MSNAPKMIDVTVDGRALKAVEGMTVHSVCTMAGVEVPTLCYLPGINEIGSCRVCVVEVEGQDNLVSSCNTPCWEGMSILTKSEKVVAARRMALQMIFDKHCLSKLEDCMKCEKTGACQLQTLFVEYDIDSPTGEPLPASKPVRDSNPFLSFNPNKCIKCQRCVSACNKMAYNHTLRTGKKGLMTTIMAPFGPNWDATGCESCGCCAAACPTGAITEKRRKGYLEWEVS